MSSSLCRSLHLGLAVATLADIPLVLSAPGIPTRMLLQAALFPRGASSRASPFQFSAREAIVPLVLAGAGTALLSAPVTRIHRAGKRRRIGSRPVFCRLVFRRMLRSALS